MGHPVLKQVAAPVERFGTRELLDLIVDMNDTMHAMNGAGLAAPQISVALRVVVFEVQAIRAIHRPRRFYTVRGSELPPLDDDEDGWGGVSVPGLRGLVPRYKR
jgi:peptide deformylase